MDDKRNEGRKLWFQRHPDVATIRSMKRRMVSHDYQDRAIYLITLCVEGRMPLLGNLCGPDSSHPQPWVTLSPLGERVKAEWLGIPRYYPQIKVLALTVMPDQGSSGIGDIGTCVGTGLYRRSAEGQGPAGALEGLPE